MSLTNRRFQPWGLSLRGLRLVVGKFSVIVLLGVFFISTSHGVPAEEPVEGQTWVEYKRKALEPSAGEHRKLVASMNTADQDALREREAKSDALILQIETSLVAVRALNAQNPLSQILAASQPATTQPDRFMGADDLVAEPGGLFEAQRQVRAGHLNRSGSGERYYDLLLEAGSAYLFARSGEDSNIDQRIATETLELCLVIPLLRTSDSAWSTAQLIALPSWMKAPDRSAILEDFCLVAGRYRTAYQFARSVKVARPAGESVSDYLDYLASVAGKPVVQARGAGVLVLTAGIAAADAAGEKGRAANMRVALAAQLDATGKPEAAAEEMKRLLGLAPDRELFAKAATLRMKYLFASRQWAILAGEAGGYERDARCKAYLPALLYLDWATNQRMGNAREVDRLREAFLAQYPDHPLGADLRLAAALRLVASGNYKDAIPTLTLIETKYPDSQAAAKATQLLATLRSKPSGGEGWEKVR
jgi:hypothetical protein